MINDIYKLIVKKNYTIRQVIEKIDNGSKGIVVVVDENNKLIGTVTDGDIRRALLNGYVLDDKIDKIIHFTPIFVYEDTTREEIKDIFIKKAIRELPVVNREKIVKDLITINDILLPEGKENPVIIMAGGLGTRLKDLTKEVPKPMLKVGNDPILQHIINNFKQYGFNKMLISVNYKAEVIQNYFQDGYAYGVKINYLKEYKRLGTAGGIKLAEDYIESPFFVINGDIFTNLNVENMLDYHIENEFDITVGIREHSFQIPYGVIEIEDNIIKELKEKPTISYYINAGVYCLNPNLIKYIPNDEYFEITDLINYCIDNGLKVGNYKINEYWMDIGRIEDYNKVNDDVYELLCLDRKE